MSNARLFLLSSEIQATVVIDDRGAIHKLKDVIRLKKNEFVSVFDGEGKEYSYRIEDVKEKAIVIKRIGLVRQEPQPKIRITLGFPLVKEEKIDYLLQKATELGVATFRPFMCERSIRQAPSQVKQIRWQRIVAEAARQSERLWIPSIEPVQSFDVLVSSSQASKIVATITGSAMTHLSVESGDVLVVVGPEGDFSETEYKKLKEYNFQALKLSKNILRVETAAIFSVGLLNYVLKE